DGAAQLLMLLGEDEAVRGGGDVGAGGHRRLGVEHSGGSHGQGGADGGAGVDPLEGGQDPLGEQVDVGPGDVVGHPGVVEDADDAGGVDAADVLHELLGDRLRGAPRLERGQEAVELVGAVLGDAGGQPAVVLVAGDVGQ